MNMPSDVQTYTAIQQQVQQLLLCTVTAVAVRTSPGVSTLRKCLAELPQLGVVVELLDY